MADTDDPSVEEILTYLRESCQILLDHWKMPRESIGRIDRAMKAIDHALPKVRAERPSSEELAAPAAPREREMREALSQVAVYTIEGDYGYVWISVNGWRVKVSEEGAAPLLKFDALQRAALGLPDRAEDRALAPSTSGGK